MVHLLGLPPEDWQRLWSWSDSVMRLMSGLADADAVESISHDVEALQAYLAAYVDPGQGAGRGAFQPGA
jgi:hypothetical protein